MINEAVVLLAVGLILLIAYKKEKIDKSAIVLTSIIGLSCLVFGNINWIIVLLMFFVLGNLASMYKKAYKKKIGCGQEIRTWKNVYGNGISAMIFVILNSLYPDPIWFYAMLASMACATADTFGTEFGQVHGGLPILITNSRIVMVGTAGAISFEGVVASMIGSYTIICIIDSMITLSQISLLIVFCCSLLGTLIDSLLGATIEQWGWINTHDVNFLSTLSSGIVFLLVTLII